MSDSPALVPGLFILGMHRSGTSCLAGMLECAGFNAGLVDEWNPDNRKGNREHLAVTPLNEAVLRVNGGAWDRPPQRVEVDDQQRREMEQVVTELEGQGRPWFIKDPRILLVPHPWLTLRPTLRTMGIFRHPLAVAQSLERRDGLPLGAGVDLWCHYNEALLAHLDQHGAPLLLFTPDAARFTTLVQAALAVGFPEEIAAGTVTPEAVGTFFSEALVHHVTPLRADIAPELEVAGVAADTTRSAVRLWQRLLERQSPEKLPLGDASTPSTGVITSAPEPLTGANLDQAIADSDNPTHLFRRRISELEAEQAHERLHDWLAGWLERRPADPFLCWELARAAWVLGRHDDALARAEATHGLAPGWVVPLEHMAEWAMEAGDWHTAAQAFRRLRRAERALVRAPELAMQLYFDQGEGFNETASVKLPLGQRTGRFETTIEAGPLGAGVRQLRLDPINQPAVVSGLALWVTNAAGERIELAPTDDSAVFHDGRAWHFDDDDPRLVYLHEALPASALRTVEVRFDVDHVGEDARLAGLRAVRTLGATLAELRQRQAEVDDLREQRSALEAQRQSLEQRLRTMTSQQQAAMRQAASIATSIRALDGLLSQVRQSFSGRLGGQLTRALMAPATLGRGRTSLDDLLERWTELAAESAREAESDGVNGQHDSGGSEGPQGRDGQDESAGPDGPDAPGNTDHHNR